MAQQQGIIEDIRVHGNRRIPAETIRSRMFTRPGDVFDPAGLDRDFNSLWNAGYFDDLRLEREESAKGWILHIYVKEKPTIREIKYLGLNAVSQSDVLDKFKELKVGLSQESQFDPTRVKKAEVVLKQLLAAHGHQYATVRTEIRQIPPAAVGITFNIKEGPTVRVGHIRIEGAKKVKARYLRDAMKNSKPIGLPHSILLENLFARTYDATKLGEDAERVRFAYQDRGYFKAIVEDPKTKMRDVGGIAWYFPFKPRHGKSVDITVPVEEGERYHLKEITFSGNKALSNSAALRRAFKIKDGDWFNRTQVSKGLDELRKAYGSLGYINETNIPDTVVDEANKTITLKIDVDEGKQFYVRRIEFSGNTTTRDKVIRRELALEEGQVYNSRLWEMSLLRLNQLNYFETLKPEQDSEVHQDVAENNVDIDLKVKEKGKNSIGLNGGVSGLSGAFIGLNYQTNNFLGLGETLSVSASLGNYQRDAMFGFTEPYFLDRPIQLGFTVFTRNFKYNQLKQAGISAGTNINVSSSTAQTFQNFSQQSTGFTLSASYPLHRSFKRVSLTYSWDTSTITTFTAASSQYFQYSAFRSVGGQNALNGILTSKLVPSFSMSTIDNPMRPHSGRSIFLGADFAGLGGNVDYIRPVAEMKQFIPMKGFHRRREGMQTLGFRLQGSFITGFAGNTAPPFERFFQGGDTDLRGFDIRAAGPAALIYDRATVNVTNPDGSLVPLDPNLPVNQSSANPNIRTVTVPITRPVYPGGDTSWVSNVEYRIPIMGPVTVAVFNDMGMNMALRNSQLKLSNQLTTLLDSTQFGCPYDVPSQSGGTISYNCTGYQYIKVNQQLSTVPGTNYQLRMSTGMELQVILPVVNAPFRIYYAYNPLRVNTNAMQPAIPCSLFPLDTGAGACAGPTLPSNAGSFTYALSNATYAPSYHMLEPRKTLRFTVATTF
jgi:outer membrane protein insertion porin family